MLDLPLTKFGVNRARVTALKALGVESLYDLVTYYPRKVIVPAVHLSHIDEARKYPLETIKQSKVTIIAVVFKISLYPPRGRMHVGRLVLQCVDENEESFEVVFFAKSMRYLKWIESKKSEKDLVMIKGVPKAPSDSLRKCQFSHPEVFVLEPGDGDISRRDFLSPAAAIDHFSMPHTVYAASKRLSSVKIASTIEDVFAKLESKAIVAGEEFTNTSEMPLFPDVQKGVSRWQAIKKLHKPKTMDEYNQALEQLKFEEAYVLQVLLARRRLSMRHLQARARVFETRGVLSIFNSNLPFTLTNSQQSAFKTISEDLSKTIPMQRLLQGDVGSGKTVVALQAMLQVVDNGGQAVLLAPTEVLASQHYASICRLLGDLNVHGVKTGEKHGVQVELLTGSLGARAKRSVESSIQSGQADIIVGTHALLYRRDSFKDLGLVVVDEQHRFGVRQRDKLREEMELIPHMLVMTATPIPRSVAMFLFADLEVSVLGEMPSGRGEIQTHIVSPSDKRLVKRMWERVREEIDAKRNVFVVAPRIDDTELNFDASGNDDDSEEYALAQSVFEKLISAGLEEGLGQHAQSVERLKADLSENPALKGVNIGVLHGRLSADEKEMAMKRFESFETPLLIATSVVEVGIDIPNASCIVITDADRFGMASLHQLRGRIGRGSVDSICFLLTSEDSVSKEGADRVKTIAKYQDGFKIAQADLKIRKEGDIMGKHQSGAHSSLKLLRVIEDQDIITKAVELSQSTLKSDPELKGHPGLKFAVARELSDQAKEYLSRS
ncbi:MAG: ATP-dependent DNA helicase RecG [Candidatus Ancillula sp.]|jgi:ATP-dependent DNA helicase RecG|nr:ATP-dependent DNA helicase RecG [Candidatus Ancillula sp.]